MKSPGGVGSGPKGRFAPRANSAKVHLKTCISVKNCSKRVPFSQYLVSFSQFYPVLAHFSVRDPAVAAGGVRNGITATGGPSASRFMSRFMKPEGFLVQLG